MFKCEGERTTISIEGNKVVHEEITNGSTVD